ncbi:YtxH domain-containing protein [Geovibrio thiophilus]|uniref:YtxH domain-containing protein n=1 Tax=Geovibrio thiophilus TaxID=139438 RepID=A0A410JXJ7_9BACT|nr:YtxH domain-containing protein [Geovibrio thiophilus]QAR32902.1 YtxH domain-containing protein [Geovibrio thiophilus]
MSDQKQNPQNPQAPQGQQYGYYPYPYPPQQHYADTSVYPHLKQWFNFREPSYVKGFAVGAGIALLLTNPTVKKAIVKGVVKVWGGLQSGVEELKEQIRDVQAEVEGE